ncbi:hypothetical protein FRC06_009868, partial [Ceratobasidium sp. 370]
MEEFSVIKAKMDMGENVDFVELEGDPDDFCRAFRILYAPLYIPTDPGFEATVLVSTLRIATRFGHSFLQSFAIAKIEALALPPIDYIPLAREFDLSHWEDAALNKLIDRDNPLTAAEGLVLGNDTLISVMTKRESILHERTLKVPTAQEYIMLPPAEQTRLKEQFRAMLGLADSPSDEHVSTASVTCPSTPSGPPSTRSRSIFTLADLATSPRSPKRPRISGNATGTVLVQKDGAGYRRVERT